MGLIYIISILIGLHYLEGQSQKYEYMIAVVNIKNLQSEDSKKVILRNLGRILDIRVVDIDIENGIFKFLYSNPIGFQKVEQELSRIGFPIELGNIHPSHPSFLHGSDTRSLTMI